MTALRKALGSLGERHARLRLEAQGMAFIDANWRKSSGEIDLVMRDGNCLVMVEVKVRRGDRAGQAEESISRSKSAWLLTTGGWFIADHPEYEGLPWQVDLVAVTIDDAGKLVRFSHIPDAVVSG